MSPILSMILAGLVIFAVLAIELGLLWLGGRLLLKKPKLVWRVSVGIAAIVLALALLPIARIVVLLSLVILTGGSFGG